ncbi:phage holin family protein [Streptomyces sp. TP-A0874]|uniref:phage holin family protein n=1 Tax=Streptomyces sp. TP-A0874 TaxID=549819 RepID=UPI0008529ED8|nr:phage holin family protein [Streptomyces sp. TP-A0874]
MSPVSQEGDRDLRGLVAKATDQLTALVREEIALLKAEVRQETKPAQLGGALVAGAAALGLVALFVLALAAAYGIHNLGLGLAWSFLVVGGAFTLLALVFLIVARAKFKAVGPPERSLASVKETAAVFRGVGSQSRSAVSAAAEERPADPSVSRSEP